MAYKAAGSIEPGYHLKDSPLGKIALWAYSMFDRIERNSLEEKVACKVLSDPMRRASEFESIMRFL